MRNLQKSIIVIILLTIIFGCELGSPSNRNDESGLEAPDFPPQTDQPTTADQTLPSFQTTPLPEGISIPRPVNPISSDNVNKIREIARWGKGTISNVKWSRSGEILAVTTSIGVYFFESNNFTQVDYFDPGHSVQDIDFSYDDSQIAVSLGYDSIQIMSYPSNNQLGIANGYNAEFVPDGQLYFMSENGFLSSIELENGELTNIKEISYDLSFNPAYYPEKNLIAFGLRDGSIKILNTNNGQEIHTLKLHEEAIWSLEFSPDGDIIASGSQDGRIVLWDVQSGYAIHAFVVPGFSDVTSLSFSPDGGILASGIRSLPGFVKLWDVKNKKELRTIDKFVCFWPGVAFSPNNEILATWCENQQEVILWDINNGIRVNSLSGFSKNRLGLEFADDDNRIIFGEEEKVIIYDYLRNRELFSLTSELRLGQVCSIKYYGESDLEVDYGKTGKITWDLSNQIIIDSIDQTGISRCDTDINGSVFINRNDGTQYEIRGNSIRWTDSNGNTHIFEHDSEVQAIEFLRGYGKILAVGQENGLISLWNLDTKEKILDLEGHHNKVNDLVISNDGKLLASASDDGTVRLWGILP